MSVSRPESPPHGPASRSAAVGRFSAVKLPPLVLIALAGKLVGVALWWLAGLPLTGALFFFGPDPFVLYALFAPSAQALCRTYTHFATLRNEVWLTIDDGPDDHDTPRILDLLDRHGARATFFVIGERAARQPGLVAEILRRGHEIAHHSHTHPIKNFWCASWSRVARELDLGLDALRHAGAQPRWFRAPVGIKNPWLAQALDLRGLSHVGWRLRSGDCSERSPERIVASVMSRMRRGDIVLMHEGPSVAPEVRVRAIALFLEACAAREFRCVLPAATQLR